jgi:hypothetical protein
MDSIIDSIRSALGLTNHAKNPRADGGRFLRETLKKSNSKSYAKMKIPDMIERFEIPYQIISRKTDKPNANLTIRNYNYRTHKVYIKLSDLLTNETLRDVVLTKCGLTVDVDELLAYMNATEDQTKSDEEMLYLNGEPCPIIQLEDSEKFRDGNTVFDVEFRGDRSVDGLLLRANDVATMFDMPTLVHHMLSDDTYDEGDDYVVLKSAKNKLSPNRAKLETDDQSKTRSMARKNAFLTWAGFLRVIHVSRCGSTYRNRLARWIGKITYTHALGSMTERQALAAELSLYKLCLNQMCGVYLIRIGKVADLRQSMKISTDQYGTDFDKAYVYKFGRSKNVLERFKQHCSLKGYGRFSDTIQMTRFAITDEGKDVEAESSLKRFFDDSHRRFEFVDSDERRHDELVILKDNELDDTIEKYHSLIIRYRNTPNEIALLIANARAEEKHRREIAEAALAISEANRSHDATKMALLEEKHRRELSEANIQIMESNHQRDLAKADANHQREIADVRAQMVQLLTKRH